MDDWLLEMRKLLSRLKFLAARNGIDDSAFDVVAGERQREDGDNFFCDICLDVLASHCQYYSRGIQNLRPVDVHHHQDLDSLERATEAGCWICSRVWKTWNTNGLLSGLHRHGIRLTISSKYPFPKDLSIVFRGPTPQQQVSFTMNPVSKAWNGRPLYSSSTSSMDTCYQARKWLHECSMNHPQCDALYAPDWHPTRLLDIQGDSGAVRLIETRHATISGRYATLSHRWPAKFETSRILCPDTYERFLEGIDLADLPQVVQDAVLVCRRLSIGYLWVDCICIIQDAHHDDDWRQQSLLMQEVYTNSYVNISAIAAKDTNDSLFRTRDTQIQEGIISTALGNEEGQIRVGEIKKRHRLIDSDLWIKSVDNAPLNRRAWVLQERLLSHRVLHFADNQIFWECNTTSAAEMYPCGLPKGVNFDWHFKNLDPKNLGLGPDQGPYEIWNSIVESYSACNLTRSGDKLIAISGLAKRVAQMIDDEYIAGMWRRHLAIQLFWQSNWDDFPHRQLTRTQTKQAPSFSWAATNNRISLPSILEKAAEMLVEVKGIHLDHLTHDVFGAVLTGWLDLECILQRVSLAESDDPSYSALQINKTQVMETVDGNLKPKTSTIFPDDFLGNFFPRSSTEAEDYLEYLDSRYSMTRGMYCVPASPRRQGLRTHQDHLLLRLVDPEEGTFERFGLARTTFYGEHASRDAERLRQSCYKAADYPCRSFNKETGRHAIRII